MLTRLQHLKRDESGMTLAYVAVGLMSFLAASTLAIDVGMLMTARSQAQNSADAGALAGTIALIVDSWDNRTPAGPAVQNAKNAALQNLVIGKAPTVTDADVTFPLAPDGQANRVKVSVYRTGANALETIIGSVFDIDTAEISATATAQASPANAMKCVKPFTIPDRWVEKNAGPWTPNSTFDRYDKKGQLIKDADVYIPPGEPGYAGYDSKLDRGLPLTLRAGTGNNIAPTMYWSWKMPGEIGGDYYRDNIANCNSATYGYGAPMTQEPGAMEGPTMQGIDDLIAKDPNAFWDNAKNGVNSPLGQDSPRIFPIPLYDPEFYAKGKANGRNADLKMANWIGFFVEKRVGNEVYGRITPILGSYDPNLGPAPAGAFPQAVRLVQ